MIGVAIMIDEMDAARAPETVGTATVQPQRPLDHLRKTLLRRHLPLKTRS